MMSGVKRAIAAVFWALALSACASDDEPADELPHDDMPHGIQACPAGIPETSIGMTVEGMAGTLSAELVGADDLPATKGFNTWTVEFTGADGEPLDDLELGIEGVLGWMPAHGHGTNHDPVIESLGDGRFEISEINFHMDGAWELTFSPTSESLGTDDMMFVLCTEASIDLAASEAEN
jgi:hypothetical protein